MCLNTFLRNFPASVGSGGHKSCNFIIRIYIFAIWCLIGNDDKEEQSQLLDHILVTVVPLKHL